MHRWHRLNVVAGLSVFTVLGAFAQTPSNPLPLAIHSSDELIDVSFSEFASLPNIEGEAAQMMLLIDEPGTERLFINDMRGPLYSISYDGHTVTTYLDINADHWGVSVQSPRRGLGVQSFAFHPQFTEPGAPGFGKLYTLSLIHISEPTRPY